MQTGGKNLMQVNK